MKVHRYFPEFTKENTTNKIMELKNQYLMDKIEMQNKYLLDKMEKEMNELNEKLDKMQKKLEGKRWW